MNFIKNIIAASLILLQGVEIVASTTTSTPTKKSQAQAKIASAKTKIQGKVAQAQAAKASKTASKPVTSSSTYAPESGQVKQLIEDFIQEVAKITCSCGSKKDKNGKKTDDNLPRCKHDKDHTETVNTAFESYKKLYEATHGSKKSITKDDNKKVRPSVDKIFNCKNIQKMAWHPHING